ncbi:MAG TPA: OsmC family peroxiredoxin [Longimicrobiales bacterium]|nr:OsmC family peroxiredoxin [Longimicrobiales bacterium]
MALAERSARSVWEGDLPKGSGRVSFDTGAIGEQRISWPARTEAANGMTSPEELIAAAQAGCFSMALAHALHQKGHKSESITVHATTYLDKVEGGVKISRIHMVIRGRVPGMDNAEFARLAQEQTCPVKNALAGNVEFSVDAALEQG